jgi:hypothetical protein
VLDLQGQADEVAHVDTRGRANQAQRVMTIPLTPAMQAEKGRFVPFARLLVDGQPVASNRCFLTGFAFKDLLLPPVAIEHCLRRASDGDEEEWLVNVQADAFAWGVQLAVPGSAWVEDNYFDLLPGEAREIRLRGRAEDVAQLVVSATNASLGRCSDR